MNKILGIDLGTNSIGWAVVEREDGQLQLAPETDGHPTKGVIVFPEGVKIEKGNIQSRASERTGYRSARRLKFRRKLRKYQTLLVLAMEKMCPLLEDEVKAWRKSGFKEYPDNEKFLQWLRTDDNKGTNPYNFRDKFSRQKMDWEKSEILRHELGRALYHMAQRRGFKSNRLDKAESELEEYVTKCFIALDETKAEKEGLKGAFDKVFSEFREEIKEKESKELSQDEKNIRTLYNNLIKILGDSHAENLHNSLEHQFKAIAKRLELEGNNLDEWVEKALAIVADNDSTNQVRALNKYFDDSGIIADDFYRNLCNEILSKSNQELMLYVLEQRLMRGMGTVAQSITDLSVKIKAANRKTLGQYFWHLYKRDRHNSENKIRNKYTAREEHYLEEFDHICQIQGIGSIDTKQSIKYPSARYSGFALDLYKAIFYQRPLKSQKGLVGKCIFEKDKPRCPVSRPEFEAFRMWQFINNIKIKKEGEDQLRPLNKAEKDIVAPRFYLSRSTFKFQDIAETLFGKEAVKLKEVAYHKDREKAETAKYIVNYKLNTTVSGNPVCAALKNIMGDDWKTKTYSYQTTNKKGESVDGTANYEDLWHVLFTFEDEVKLKEYAEQKLRLIKDAAKKFSKLSLPQGYSNLSLKASNKILPWLETGLIYPHAVFMANIENVVDEKIWQNADDRKDIEEDIADIIESQRYESRKTIAVNSLIKRYKKEKSEYSKEAEYIYKMELEEKLKSIFGKQTWVEKEVQEENLNDAFELLKNQFKKIHTKKAYAKVKRLDERVIEFLKGENKDGVVYCSDESRLQHLYHPSDLEGFQPEKGRNKNGEEIKILPLPKSDAIKNPVLMRAMHQLRKLINELLVNDIIDDETRIHIELAREVNDANKRIAWKQWQDKLRDENEEIEQIIGELFKEQKKKNKVENDDLKKARAWSEQLVEIENDKPIIENNRLKPVNVFELTKAKKTLVEKYKLWKEQKGICVYTGKAINMEQLFDGTSFDVEHTIPRSRSWDNSMMNKTVADAAYQRKEKGNKIPYELGEEKQEEMLQRITHWKKRYEKLDDVIKNIKPSKTDPERRSRQIVDKHLKTFERDYWKGKYERFTMEDVPEGFKNSQTTDTGLITRFARHYMSCLFRTEANNSNVRVVNGIAVSEFRKAWGLQKEYEKKSRTNHIHHCIDAVTIACMTKEKYDAFAEEWRKAEENDKYDVKRKLAEQKPWKNFTEDVKKLEDEVLIVHTHKDNVPKQSRKKLRKRGKVQYKVAYKKDANGNYLKDKNDKRIVEKYYYLKDINGNRIPVLGKKDQINPDFILHTFKDPKTKALKQEVLKPGTPVESGENTLSIRYSKYVKSRKTGEVVYQKQPIYLKGDTVRGSLHQETFYGAVKQPERDEKNGKPKHSENGAFILRRDNKGRDEITYVVRKELKKLKKDDIEKIIDPVVQSIIDKARTDDIIKFSKTGASIKDGAKIWMKAKDSSKKVEIKKVRIKAKLAEPLREFKEQKDKKKNIDGSEKHPHKKWINVQNAENYCLAIYENKDRTKRASRIVKMIDAAEYFNENHDYRQHHPLVEEKKDMELKGLLKPDTLVLFYKDRPEELWELDQTELRKRLYKVRKTSKNGQTTFQFHQEARTDKQLEEDYEKKYGTKAPPWWKNGKGNIDYDNMPIHKYLLSPVNMKMLIEGTDFTITHIGKIQQL